MVSEYDHLDNIVVHFRSTHYVIKRFRRKRIIEELSDFTLYADRHGRVDSFLTGSRVDVGGRHVMKSSRDDQEALGGTACVQPRYGKSQNRPHGPYGLSSGHSCTDFSRLIIFGRRLPIGWSQCFRCRPIKLVVKNIVRYFFFFFALATDMKNLPHRRPRLSVRELKYQNSCQKSNGPRPLKLSLKDLRCARIVASA